MSKSASQPDWNKLIRRLEVLPEQVMRREVLLEQLIERDPDEVLDFFLLVSQGSQQRRPAHLLAFEALCLVAQIANTHERLYELLAEVYRLARERGDDEFVQILVTASPQRGPMNPQQVPGDQQLSQLSLGERKYLARGHDRHRLERLLLDPEPSVLRNLLRNPSIVESDVVRLAARRPVRDAVLREVHASRWGQRYRVRLALVLNPYAPPDLALKLLGLLLYKDLKLAVRDGNLHPMIRRQAARLLKHRRPARQTRAVENQALETDLAKRGDLSTPEVQAPDIRLEKADSQEEPD